MSRSFTGMVAAGMVMSRAAAGLDPHIGFEKAGEVLAKAETFSKELVKTVKDKTLLVALGQGMYYGIAGEATIKIQEMCLLPTGVYYTMEYRHGPVSIADENTVCLIYCDEKTSDISASIARELKALGVIVIAFGSYEDSELDIIADYSFKVDATIAPLCIFAAQYLGAFWAIEKGLDPDRPRNLTKAVLL
jgi:glucosamine--fructose-6-phosphate aminotransferase (isomerizing)